VASAAACYALGKSAAQMSAHGRARAFARGPAIRRFRFGHGGWPQTFRVVPPRTPGAGCPAGRANEFKGVDWPPRAPVGGHVRHGAGRAADMPLGEPAYAAGGRWHQARGHLVLPSQFRWGSLCQSPGRSVPGWPECALPSTPGSKKSASALAFWCWPGRPPSLAAPQRPRSSPPKADHRQRRTGRWRASRGQLRRRCPCAYHGLLHGHFRRARPRRQHTAPPRPQRPAPRTPPPPPPPAGRAPPTDSAAAGGHRGTGITSPPVTGGTTATADGRATTRGTTVMADGITVAGRTTSAGIAPVTAIDHGDQAKKTTTASTARVRCGAQLLGCLPWSAGEQFCAPRARFCRIEDVALVHAYAQVDMIIRDWRSPERGQAKRLTQSRSSQIADYACRLA
jgi:hypothetical protein